MRMSRDFRRGKPMIRYMESLREPGRVTARCYHNIVSDEKIPRTAGCAILKIRPSVGLVPVGISTGAGLLRRPRG